jgi:hypothetical protein
MRKMQLSEAVRLGSLLLERVAAGHTTTCAVGMALLANGIEPRGLGDYDRLMAVYPWLRRRLSYRCPCCRMVLRCTGIMAHPFDRHVMKGQLTLEALCEWIAEIETTRIRLTGPRRRGRRSPRRRNITFGPLAQGMQILNDVNIL